MNITTTQFKRVIDTAKRFVWSDKNQDRATLNCIRFDVISATQLDIVGIDGTFMNKFTIHTDTENLESCNIPPLIVKEILNDIKGTKELSVSVKNDTLTINDNTYTINADIFPDYKKAVIDVKELPNELVMDRKELLAILKNNKNNVSKRTQLGILEYYGNELELTFADRINDIKNIVKLPSDYYNGIVYRIGFNVKFLTLILSKLKSKEIKINFGTDKTSQFQIRGTDTKDNDIMFLLMPLRIVD